MTITLLQYKRGYGVANLSPFCMKAEVLLKMSGLDFDIEVLNDPRKSPKGKLPVIRDDGQLVADTAFIQRHLEEAHGIDFNAGLSQSDQATGHALARLCEERLYWIMVYSRWIEEENWPAIAEFWFGDMPPVMRSIIPIVARKEVRKNLHAHGVGRHAREEIYALGTKDVHAIAAILGETDFLFGDTPSAADATVYPFVENMLIEALPSPLLEVAKGHDTLPAYVARCRALWFADLDA